MHAATSVTSQCLIMCACCLLQDLLSRPRRNRKSETVRRAFSETVVLPANFILPVFVHDGDKVGGQQGRALAALPACAWCS